jgi:hypothetical protein
MIKTIVNMEYTKLNALKDPFLIQNISNYDLLIVVSDDRPDKLDPFELIVEPKKILTSEYINGICWGKTSSKFAERVTVIENKAKSVDKGKTKPTRKKDITKDSK